MHRKKDHHKKEHKKEHMGEGHAHHMKAIKHHLSMLHKMAKNGHKRMKHHKEM